MDKKFQFGMVDAACLTRHQIYTVVQYVMDRWVSNRKKSIFSLLSTELLTNFI